ncbi:MAG: lipoyl(octanoyl) transferase LipB [Gammaproteobacteria bacterium]|nr:lipoyl(octanoyl) transferase LipB [Gammaproteobacteria bacterium]
MIVRQLGTVEYTRSWEQMKSFNSERDSATADEIWLLQHPPVFTQGLKYRPEHEPVDYKTIPVVHSDRGGDITYHGPGQLVAYLLIDMKRKNMGIKTLVTAIEESIMNLLEDHNISGKRKSGAPGIYVTEKKIASLGLRVRQGASYHGLSLNVDMDLKPFSAIPPCGFRSLEMTQIADFYPNPQINDIGSRLVAHLGRNLGYNKIEFEQGGLFEQSPR